MGNTESSPTTAPAVPPTPKPEPATSAPIVYRWPENLYTESRDMAAASFLVYTFAFLQATAREQKGLKGLNVDKEGRVYRSASSASLTRSFSPQEVLEIVTTNMATLADHFPSEFKNPEMVLSSLQVLKDRVESAAGTALTRPLTLLAFDDKHQLHELVYGVAKDDINRRITLCFRGTENELALKTNWLTNLYLSKTEVKIPTYLEGKVGFDNVYFHSGFYNYLFQKTFEESDSPDKKKFDEIMDDIGPLLKANPDYKLYVTGHSLGGALAAMASFYFANNPDIPKPVTCITFAAPRIGDYNFLQAVQVLEQRKKIRICRIINDNDLIGVAPSWGYFHAGFQVRLWANDGETKWPPEVTFPKIEDTYANRLWRTWGNSFFMNFDVTYDHMDYRERIEQSKEFLEEENLNDFYKNDDMTGF